MDFINQKHPDAAKTPAEVSQPLVARTGTFDLWISGRCWQEGIHRDVVESPKDSPCPTT